MDKSRETERIPPNRKKGVGASRTSGDETKDNNNNKTRLFRFRFDYIDGRGEHPHNTVKITTGTNTNEDETRDNRLSSGGGDDRGALGNSSFR